MDWQVIDLCPEKIEIWNILGIEQQAMEEYAVLQILIQKGKDVMLASEEHFVTCIPLQDITSTNDAIYVTSGNGLVLCGSLGTSGFQTFIPL